MCIGALAECHLFSPFDADRNGRQRYRTLSLQYYESKEIMSLRKLTNERRHTYVDEFADGE